MGAYKRTEEFFAGWRFPVIIISVLFFLVVAMVAILVVPDVGSPASDFARDFKVWCFGYDPETGAMEWAYLWLFLVQPILMVALVVVVWYRQLAAVLMRAPRLIVPWVLGSFFSVVLLAAGLPIVADEPSESGTIAFPAQALRTEVPAAAFTLTDHNGSPRSLDDFSGQVVLMTAAYTQCRLTCPLIMAEVKHIVGRLDPIQRKEFAALVVTLDPAHDSPGIMNDLITHHELAGERVYGLSGSETQVTEVLDHYGFTRWIDEETGAIGHTNLFVLIDRKGSIAYRFALGEQQEAWLTEALQLLLSEKA